MPIAVLIGISPKISLPTILILTVTMLTKTSAIAGIISSWVVCNPLTSVPIYSISIVAENNATPFKLSWQRVKRFLESISSDRNFTDPIIAVAGLGFAAIVVMIVGGIALALPFTMASYYLSFNLFIKMQLKNQRKHSNRRFTKISDM